eukprot:4900150-Alexandrium_andersonii.AAC.1
MGSGQPIHTGAAGLGSGGRCVQTGRIPSLVHTSQEVNMRTPHTAHPPHWCAVHIAANGKHRFCHKIFCLRRLATYQADL